MVHVCKKGAVLLIQGAVLWRNNRQQERSCWAVDASSAALSPSPTPREEAFEGAVYAHFLNSGWYEYPFGHSYHAVWSGSNFYVREYSDQKSYWPVLSSGTGNYDVLPSLDHSYVNLSKSFISCRKINDQILRRRQRMTLGPGLQMLSWVKSFTFYLYIKKTLVK